MIFKKYLSLFMVLFLVVGCMKDIPTNSNDTEEYTLVGRWVMVGFEEAVLYEFTENLRYTIYASEPGVFGPIDEAMNPHPLIHNYDGSITIDLHFGNSVTYTPEFSCEGRVVNFWLSDDEIHSTLIKENFNAGNCY